MSRPSAWSRVWQNFWASFGGQKTANRRYVGEDQLGNRFYEYSGQHARSSVKRGYDPGPKPEIEPSLEWITWLSGTRRFPPSDKEIAINQARQQSQLKVDNETERRAPHVASEGRGAADVDRPKQFPTYKDAELTPGARKPDK